jgi:hypothetical protein
MRNRQFQFIQQGMRIRNQRACYRRIITWRRLFTCVEICDHGQQVNTVRESLDRVVHLIGLARHTGRRANTWKMGRSR